MGTLWDHIEDFPVEFREALRLLALSYNATHSTLMTRVVVKQGQPEFVITGAQSGVLYISGLPVEKNIFEGVRRKLATIAQAFEIVRACRGTVRVVKASSSALDMPDASVDYVFTDPPFGDFIPYSEVNFLNEVWLGAVTDRSEEVVMSRAQGKDRGTYERLIGVVFAEMARVLKDHGRATVVFHAARSDMWAALQTAISKAGFSILQSSVLDKVQGSFKQVTSMVSVKSDPLILLAKGPPPALDEFRRKLKPVDVLDGLVASAAHSADPRDREVQRLFSRFVGHYLEHSEAVPMDASEFYPLARARLAHFGA
jgi:hypothetical protein